MSRGYQLINYGIVVDNKMEMEKRVEPEESESDNAKMLLANDNSMSSYGACREASNEVGSVMATPIRKYQFRLCTVTCSCMVAIQTWFLYGYSIVYTAPVLK